MNFLVMPLLVVCLAMFAIAAFASVYHWGLAAVAAIHRGGKPADSGGAQHTFAIVIPAHNEAATIQRTLDSCAALRYPHDKLTVCVIADNCTDDTAEVARKLGATCLVRHDEQRRGKGFALEWALPKVLTDGRDAVVVLDADCLISANSLDVLDARLQAGSRVLQMNNQVVNPDQNAITYLLAIANTLENELFYAPKSVLGLAVNLRGTGMVFHRGVLLQCPWHARSAAEDAEYSQRLFREGIAIEFVPQCGVVSASPVNRAQLAVQRTRWIGGAWRLACVSGLAMFVEGVRTRRGRLLDAALTGFVQSRPLVALQLLLTVAVCGLLCFTAWRHLAVGLLLATAAFAVGYVAYGLIGVLMLGLTRRRITMLLCLPPVVVQYMVMATRVLFSFKTVSWMRTPRS